MRIDDGLYLADSDEDDYFTVSQIRAVLAGGVGGGRGPARTTMTASYQTGSVSPTVFYTALYPNGTTLTTRRTSGVTLSATGDYTFVQSVAGVDQFIAVWDEGNVNDFVMERIVVDT